MDRKLTHQEKYELILISGTRYEIPVFEPYSEDGMTKEFRLRAWDAEINLYVDEETASQFEIGEIYENLQSLVKSPNTENDPKRPPLPPEDEKFGVQSVNKFNPEVFVVNLIRVIT